MFTCVETFISGVAAVQSEAELQEALQEVSTQLGFRFFALTHHVNIRAAPQPAIRLHNYPSDWVAYFDANGLGPSDPVHRACHLTSIGFAWSKLPRMIDLTPRDREILAFAQVNGLGEGFTVPAHVPGEANGSCSFAVAAGQTLSEAQLPAAHLVGAFAFEAARRLARVRAKRDGPRPLTDRQRDCVLWAARGKTDWEIARILGISHETVIRHLKDARDRYAVTRRTQLAISALFDGTLNFNDVL